MRVKDPKLMDKILEKINNFYFDKQHMPSVNDLALALGISKSTVHRYLIDMDEQGLLSYKEGNIITDIVNKLFFETVNAPLLGYIQCGEPFPDEECAEEYIPLPVTLFGDKEKFILQASGDSMVDAGINSGDWVVIERQNSANFGDIIVALVDHHEVTLKRLLYDRELECQYLHPENPKYEDMYFSEIEIQGKLSYVIKRGPF